MKTGIQGGIFIKALACIFMVIGVSMAGGCNPDAFVRHISPSSRTLDFSEDGDSAVIRFKASDWWVYKVSKGGKEYHPGISSEPAFDGKQKILVDNTTLYLEESGHKGLSVFLGPNFSNQEIEVKIFISNNYEDDSVTVRQPASSGYEFVDISWDKDVRRFGNEIETGWGPLSYKNTGADTLFIDHAVFYGAARTISLTGDSDFGFHSEDFCIPVPDGALSKDNSLTFSGEQAFYSYSTTHEYPYRSDKVVKMAFPPDGNLNRYYKMLWGIDSYKVGYTMAIRNRKTGRLLTINGEMTSVSPNGTYYLIFENR